MQFRKAYFRSLVHPSRKLWPKPNSGNSVPCIMPCKIGGSWNFMKEQYLSKTPFLTFVYLSKFNINLPCIFQNSKKRFYEPVLCSYLSNRGLNFYPPHLLTVRSSGRSFILDNLCVHITFYRHDPLIKF